MTNIRIVYVYCEQCPRSLRTTPAVARKHAPASCPGCGAGMRISPPFVLQHPTGSSPDRAA